MDIKLDRCRQRQMYRQIQVDKRKAIETQIDANMHRYIDIDRQVDIDIGGYK